MDSSGKRVPILLFALLASLALGWGVDELLRAPATSRGPIHGAPSPEHPGASPGARLHGQPVVRGAGRPPGEMTATSNAPSHAVSSPACVVRGLVRRDDGTRLADVHLLASDIENRYSWIRRRGRILGEARSDAEGRFSLSMDAEGLQRVWLHAEAPEGLWQPRQAPAVPCDAAEVEIVLRSAFSVRGVVLGVDGRPEAGVPVEARWRTASRAGLRHHSGAKTDAEGTFELPVMAELVGGWIGAAKVHAAPRKDRRDPLVLEIAVARAPLPTAAGRLLALRLVQSSAALDARVVDAAGEPTGFVLAGLRSAAPADDDGPRRAWWGTWNGFGDLRVRGLPRGAYRLGVRLYDDVEDAWRYVQDFPVEVPSDGVVLRAPEETQTVSLVGHVREPHSARVRVEWHGAGDGNAWKTGIGPDGRFDLPAGGAGAVLWVRDEGANRQVVLRDLAPPYPALEVDLEAGFEIRGVVEPAYDPGAVRRRVILTQGSLELWVPVADDGAFVARGLPPGVWTLRPYDDRDGLWEIPRIVRAGDVDVRVSWPRR